MLCSKLHRQKGLNAFSLHKRPDRSTPDGFKDYSQVDDSRCAAQPHQLRHENEPSHTKLARANEAATEQEIMEEVWFRV